jgi:hypothetical protein
LTREVSPITAVGVYTGSLVVHQAGRAFLFITNGAPYNVGGEVTWYIKELVIDRGSLTQHVLADLGEKNIYLTTRGIHELSGIQALQSATTTIDTINAKPISWEVEPTLFNYRWDAAVAVYYKFYYIIVLKSAGSINNDVALVYDTRRKKWLPPWSNYGFSCFEVAKIGDEEVCFAGSDTDSNIYTLFTDVTDAGTPIESWFVLNYMNFGKPDHTKTFRRVAFWPKCVDGGVYLGYSIDFGQQISIGVEYGAVNRTRPLGSFLLGTDVLGQQQRLNRSFALAFRGRRGRNISIKISNNNAAGTGKKSPFAIECIRIAAYTDDEDKRTNL